MATWQEHFGRAARHKNGGLLNLGKHRSKHTHKTFRNAEQIRQRNKRKPRINVHP